MRGPRPAYPIELTTQEVEQLRQLVRAHTSPQAQVVRARIILQAFEHPESSNQQIAAHVGTSDRQVRAQVTAIACSIPRMTGTPLSRWSRADLARRVAQDPTLPHISARAVGRWLRAERIRPWRYHAWQHIHDPISFLQRARPVLQAYVQAQALLQAGTWLVSVDEKTSIQAREGEQPPRPASPGKPLLHEARYSRRGARHLFAGLSIADGQV